jgi:hypothetical protein
VRRPAPRTVGLALVALAVVAAISYVVARSGDATAPVEETVRAAPAVELTLGAEPTLELEGEELALHLPLETAGSAALRIEQVGDVPTGFSVLLPDGGLVVRPAETADLRVGWRGPRCESDAPASLLASLELSVRPDAAAGGAPSADVLVLDTSAADALLLGARRMACADEPPPTPGDEVPDDVQTR